MKLKRHFKKIPNPESFGKGGEPLFDDNGDRIQEFLLELDENGKPILDHVTIEHVSKRQNFTQKFLDSGLESGFLTLSKGMITLHAKPKDIQFKIIRKPGYYCCFDDAPMGSGKEAIEYIQKNFPDQKSPCNNNPVGYRKDNFFACQLISEEVV